MILLLIQMYPLLDHSSSQLPAYTTSVFTPMETETPVGCKDVLALHINFFSLRGRGGAIPLHEMHGLMYRAEGVFPPSHSEDLELHLVTVIQQQSFRAFLAKKRC